MKRTLGIFLLILLSACSRYPVEVESNVQGVHFSTNKNLYFMDERMWVELKNNTPAPLMYSCFYVERASEDEWEQVGPLGGCGGNYHTMCAGCDRTNGGVVDSAGTYRLVATVLLQQDWQQKEYVYSNRFIVKP